MSTTRVTATRYCCQICGKSFRASEVVSGDVLHGPLQEKICADYPHWSDTDYICLADLNRLRQEFFADNMKTEHGELDTLQQEVMDSIQANESIVKNLNATFAEKLTFGQRIADKVAEFGGSWSFIIIFIVVLIVWMGLNSIPFLYHRMLKNPFDLYPFMALNLVLSCIAALQAPVIMMSQNRQEAKDRLRAEQDFRTNLKAELEIRTLHAKMDELITHQWQRLLDIQQVQMDMMEEMTSHHRWERDHSAGKTKEQLSVAK
jgi:uncharacterized membrane protein